MTSPTPHTTPSLAGGAGASRHLAGVTLNGSLTFSLVAVSLVFIAVAVGATGVLTSVFTGGIHDGQPKQVIDDLVAKHDQTTDEYKKRFEQRYIFYKPPPPPPPPRPVVKDPEPAPVVVDTGPKIPPTYQGPSIAWVIGDDVYFNMIVPTQTEKYMRVSVGEERAGVKVLSTEKMPRTIRVAHAGGEYDVKVFGDNMSTAALFPVAPRPSILVPGFIPAGAQGAAETAPASAEAEAAGTESIDNAPGALNATPANGEERRAPPGDRRRPDGRGRGGSRGNGNGGGGGDRGPGAQSEAERKKSEPSTAATPAAAAQPGASPTQAVPGAPRP